MFFSFFSFFFYFSFIYLNTWSWLCDVFKHPLGAERPDNHSGRAACLQGHSPPLLLPANCGSLVSPATGVLLAPRGCQLLQKAVN